MQLVSIASPDAPFRSGVFARLARTNRLATAGVLVLISAACSESTVTGPQEAQPASTAQNNGHTGAGSGTATVSSNPISGAVFWVDPNSNAKRQADAWRSTRPADAAQMDKIAASSQAQWFGDWNSDIYSAVSSAVTTIANAGALPTLVAYNIPQRDCGGYSAGGTTVDGYKTWISAFARGIGGRKALVILEPDALAGMDCLSAADQQTRISLIQYAVQVLKAQGQAYVYLDGGHPGWKSASEMASRLTLANVSAADGFFENVSNFISTSDNVSYGTSISSLTGGKHFLIDTSRNGQGPTTDYQWCNPSGRGLGLTPTTQTGNSLIDAFLWIKRPGESDGTCNGGPDAGTWWADYALGLAQRAV